jgi:hypothetical protein
LEQFISASGRTVARKTRAIGRELLRMVITLSGMLVCRKAALAKYTAHGTPCSDVCFWHKADIGIVPSHVSFRG